MSDPAEGQKTCPDCGETKPVTSFNRNASRPDGLQFYCKSCFSVRGARTYRKKRARLGKTVREKIEVPAEHKYCPTCRQCVPYSEWHRTRGTRDGLVSECKACRKVRARRDYLKRTFGLTQEDLAVLIASQGGTCAICREGKPEHIDHDHKSGRVRGVLCGPCNMGLGLFKDDPRRLEAASDYLHRDRVAALGLSITEVKHDDVIVEVNFRWPHAA
jgi:hypothetical protein